MITTKVEDEHELWDDAIHKVFLICFEFSIKKVE